MYSGTDIGAAYYRAYSEFRTLLLGDAFRVDLTLRAGDVMIMNNRRILHGRTAFNPTGERHLRGAYCDFDGIASKARALSAAAVTPGSVQGPHDLVSRATATAMWFLQRQAAVTYGEGCTMLSCAVTRDAHTTFTRESFQTALNSKETHSELAELKEGRILSHRSESSALCT